MSWVRIDDKLSFHRKVLKAGNEALGAWIRMLTWCSDHLTDGAIPDDLALLIAGQQTVIDRLVVSNLIELDQDGYRIHDYHDHNPTANEVRSHRDVITEQKVASGKYGGIRSGIARRSRIEANAKQTRSTDEANAKQTTKHSASSLLPVCFAENEAKRSPQPSPIPILKDPNPAGSASPPAPVGQLEMENGEPAKPSGKPDSAHLVSHYAEQWVKTQKPADGKPPDITQADRGQARQLVGKYGLEACKDYVDRYLVDPDPWLARNGYALKHLPKRVDGYRARASPAGRSRGIEPPVPHSDVTEEYKF